MEKKLIKAAVREADALNQKVDQQARGAAVELDAPDGPRRRTWEGYAADFHALSERLVEVSRAKDEAIAEIKGLERQLEVKESDLRRVKARRLKDLERLAAISRHRDLLEKRSSAQTAKVAAALARHAELLTVEAPAAVELPPAWDTLVPPADEVEPALGDMEEAKPATEPESEVENEKAQIEERVHFADSEDVLAVEAEGKGQSDEIREIPRIVEVTPLAVLLAEQADRKLGWSERRWWGGTIKAAQKAHKERRLDDAEAAYESALRTNQTASLWEQLGHVLREAGRFGEAELSYRRALRRCPDNAELIFLSAYCLENAGHYPAAVSLYEATLVIDPAMAARFDHLRDFHARLKH